MVKIKIFGLLISVLLLTSCVTQRKYDEVQQYMESYRADSTAWAEQVTALRNSISLLEEKNAACQQRFDSLSRSAAPAVKQVSLIQPALQDTAIEAIYQQLKDQATSSGIIQSVKKVDNQLQVEFKSSAKKADKLTAETREAVYKISESIRAHRELELIPVENWSDIPGAEKANIGDSAWVGSAGMGREDANMETSSTGRKVDSASTAAVGSQPYPGSGAVAMNTTKSKRRESGGTRAQSYRTMLLQEFARHGVVPLPDQEMKEESAKSAAPLRFIIRERIHRGS